MKKLLMAFAIVSMGIFASCDKCKDTDCLNGSSCESGDCECSAFYTGDNCESEIRQSYNVTYSGITTYEDGSTDVGELSFKSYGEVPSKLLMDEFLPITLTNSTSFTIEYQEVDGTDIETYSGSGNFTSTGVTFTLNYTYSEAGQVYPSETFSFAGTKVLY